MPDSGHIPRMILALPWSQSDNNNNNNNDNNNKNNNNNMNNKNNSPIFIRLLDTNPKIKALHCLMLPETLPTAELDFAIVIT